jgi:hypothetical protein
MQRELPLISEAVVCRELQGRDRSVATTFAMTPHPIEEERRAARQAPEP